MSKIARRVKLCLQEHFYLPKDQAEELIKAYSFFLHEEELDIENIALSIENIALNIYGAADRDGFFAEEDSISDAS